MTFYIIYLAVFTSFAARTIAEGNGRLLGWGVSRWISIASCLIWPVPLTLILIIALSERSGRQLAG